MAGLFDWSTVASENTTIDGINTATGMPVSNTDNVFRSTAALIRQSFTSALETFLSGAASLPIANGGTGGASASAARTNLGLGTLAVENTAPIAQGGTGATTAATAFANIAITASSLSTNGYVKFKNGLMIQWGRGTLGNNTPGTITYPTAFTTFSICLAGGGSSSTGTADQVRRYGAATTTGATIVNPDDNSVLTYEWIAIGV